MNEDHIIEDDGEINDLFQTEVQGESSSTSVNHSEINFENIYPCTNSEKPSRESTIRWDTVLRAAVMAGFDATYEFFFISNFLR